MSGAPDLVRRQRAGDTEWLDAFDLSAVERDRIEVMAADGGMEVMCSLYRSNRLTALVRTVPSLVDALGPGLRDEVSAFWVGTPRTDMQFRTEGAQFCRFVRERHPDLGADVDLAERRLAELYGSPC